MICWQVDIIERLKRYKSEKGMPVGEQRYRIDNYLIKSWVGSAVLLTCALLAVLIEKIEILYVGISLGLFAVGIVLCIRAFARSLVRSRYQVITTSDLFLLSTVAPRSIRLWHWGSFISQVITGIVFAVLQESTNFAFGILASVFALGNVSMWAMTHCSFPERINKTPSKYESDDYE
jgi:hypothetical protein